MPKIGQKAAKPNSAVKSASHPFRILHGNCLDVLPTLPAKSIDAVVTDPPYELGFMGKSWDSSGIAYNVEMWSYVLRALKPGGYLLAFSGTRTYHRMVCAIEDAGFDICDQLAWVFGCLDTETQLVTPDGVSPYYKSKVGDLVLCFDADKKEYSYQPIMEIVEYDYSDTAYRLISDHGEQVVSRNHRCIVERAGAEVFAPAETLQLQESVPFLESLSELQEAIHNQQPYAGYQERDVQQTLQELYDRKLQEGKNHTVEDATGAVHSVCGVQQVCMEAGSLAPEGQDPDVQPNVQRTHARGGVEETRSQRTTELESPVGNRRQDQNDREPQPSVERGSHVQEPQGTLCSSADQIRQMSDPLHVNVEERRLRDGAQAGGRPCSEETSPPSGGGAPHRSRRNEQLCNQPHALQDQRRAQGVREWSGHKTSMVRVVPFHYTGKVWCLRVPTGAFVAVRNGVAFPTGNSGFPKGLNASKGVDKFFGYEWEMMRYEQGQSAGSANTVGGSNRSGAKGESRPWIEEAKRKGFHEAAGDTPVGADAKKWYGWGSTLKPAYEPIVLAQKPLDGSIARNLTRHGVGAMNIDGCRVGTEGGTKRMEQTPVGPSGWRTGGEIGSIEKGRWPANLIHDGSDEATVGFPKTGATKKQLTVTTPSQVFTPSKGKGGCKARGGFASIRDYDEPAGSAARYFYCAKASRLDRDEGLDDLPISQTAVLGISEICAKCGVSQRHAYEPQNKGKCDHEWTGSPQRNIHTTVKPVSLMRWLVRLITPPGGTVLDPFTGSGSTGKACGLEGMKFTGIEMTDDYLEIARLRTQFGYDNYGSKE